MAITNPILFFTAPFKYNSAKQIQTRFQSEKKSVNSAELKQYREARRIVSSIDHPDTGKPIPFYGRMTGFVPINMPIAFVMIMSKPTIFNIVAGQWLNQSYNAGMNYCNRNATSLYTKEDILKGYASAVIVSVGLGLTLQTIFKGRINKIPSRGKQLVARAFLTYTAAGLAGSSNVLMMRQKQLSAGISIFDHEGKEHGKSLIAAKRAVYFTSGSRLFMTLPTIILPAVASLMFETMGILPQGKLPKALLQLVFCGIALQVGLVGSISMFEQQVTIDAKSLQTQFHSLTDSKGLPIEKVRYNKGL